MLPVPGRKPINFQSDWLAQITLLIETLKEQVNIQPMEKIAVRCRFIGTLVAASGT